MKAETKTDMANVLVPWQSDLDCYGAYSCEITKNQIQFMEHGHN